MAGMRATGWCAIAVAVLAACMSVGARAQTNEAQVCMFRCAPVIGTSTYDGCLDTCFAEADETGGVADRGADFSALHGYWIDAQLACGTPSMDAWDIDATGASQFDFTCTVEHARKSGRTYVLKQSCADFEGEAVPHESRFRIVGANRMENGKRYRRCPRP